MNSLKKYDVSIVGFGPSGAVLALLLARSGLSVHVIDKTQEIYDKPRAIALDHEVMRTLQNLGLSDSLAEFIEPFTDSHYLGVEGQLIKIMSTPAPPFAYGHIPALVFNQPSFEKVLRQAISESPNIEVSLNCELKTLIQNENEVSMEVLTHQVGEQPMHQTVVSQYLVGCDGASSTVRKSLQIELEDLGFNEPWLVVDLLVEASALSKLPQTSMQYCDPKRPITMVIGPKNHRRFEIALSHGETPDDFKDESRIWDLLSQWLEPGQAQLWRHACYEFHALVAERWRVGRIFIAGDAAHQQPPFLGQGMCQGIRDVVNLSWKLKQAIEHPPCDQILNSYETERKAHVKALTAKIIEIGKIVGQRDEQKARARDLHLLHEAKGEITPTARQDVQPSLNAGCFSTHTHPKRGTLFPQPLIRLNKSEQRMDDNLGIGWRVFSNLNPSPDTSNQDANQRSQTGLSNNAMLTSMMNDLGMHWFDFEIPDHDPQGLLRTWFEQAQATWVIVRPDHYVYGAGREQLELAEELVKLKQLFGL